MKYKLTISYDGTNYSGWQTQPNGKSIQQIIQSAALDVLGEETFVTGSGRTDAGVHALGQVAHIQTEKEISLDALNEALPPDIRILHVEPVDDQFHARYSAKGKIYRYRIHKSLIENPFTSKFTCHIPSIDIDFLKKSAKHFIGKKDFTSFANEAHRGCAKNQPIKELRRLDVIANEEEVILEFEADGFLYKMVRNIVGTLFEISSKKIHLSEIEEIFAAKDRRRAAGTAPARGLFLMKVLY